MVLSGLKRADLEAVETSEVLGVGGVEHFDSMAKEQGRHLRVEDVLAVHMLLCHKLAKDAPGFLVRVKDVKVSW